MSILDVADVHKRYLTRPALVGVGLHAEPGQVVGVLGPNGSGKTTLLKILAGLLRPDAGTVVVAGQTEPDVLRQTVALLPDREFLPGWLSVRDAGELYQRFHDDFDPDAFADFAGRTGLEPTTKVRAMSKGTVEKLGLALTMARNAPLIVLDEPLSGVDPLARDEIIRTIVTGIRPESILVVTSHLVGELESLLDRVVLLDAGRVVLEGEADQVRAERGASLDGVYREVFAR